MSDYIEQVFGAGGLLAARFPGYEMREGQVALARLVDQAMREGKHALGEGPCGTGKGLSYGVPAVWHAHHRQKQVVVATANIALQEQLVCNDLPLLSEVLPWKFSFALLKGRNNFLCKSRLRRSDENGGLCEVDDPEEDRQIEATFYWAEDTVTGDVSELPFVPLPQVWSKFSVSADECLGGDCPFLSDCFAERTKAAAHAADIVVTNYHLLFAHLAVRRETGQDLVLPPFDLLVCDEAHEAAEIARDFFGFTVSERTVRGMDWRASELGDEALAERLRDEAGNLFAEIDDYARSPEYRCRLRRPGFVDASGLAGALRRLASLAQEVQEEADLGIEERSMARTTARLARATAVHLEEVAGQSDENKVYWIERDARGWIRLRAKPIDVSNLLREELFSATPSVTMVSATLTAGGSFGFVRRELGVPEGALEVVAESPFDFGSQALLVVPEGLPDPREPEFAQAVSTVLARVMDLCDGRTLGLFTSYKNLNAVYERVSGNGHRVLRQGDLPRTELARVFKEDVSSVLLGTESFWTGIDVPGEALTGLVIDKLPFPHPEDPVVSAICERDRQAFFTYMVPRAIIALRQGVGRLIRSRRDVGVVVLLDRRVAEMRYGRRFLQSLPRMMTTRKLDNIPRFLEEVAAP